MINEQLLNFIKEQKNKGVSEELITKELSANGWTIQNIEEGFKKISSVPTPPYFDNELSKKEPEKKKSGLFKKILIILLILLFAVYVAFEIVNYLKYASLLNQYKERIAAESTQEFRIPVSHGKPIYRPVIAADFYKIFPSLDPYEPGTTAKPVIYLYPTSTEKVKVQLDYKGKLIADYPKYNIEEKGWAVTAYPDGKIIDSDGKEYSYLFWEGIPSVNPNYDLSTGFIVKGENTREFLQETLAKMGLTPKEYNEFIVYWYPKMKDNKYNLIHFAEKEYTDIAPLTITPKPDSTLRVFMVFKPINKLIEIKNQEIKPFSRTGFSVVEWGGTELSK